MRVLRIRRSADAVVMVMLTLDRIKAAILRVPGTEIQSSRSDGVVLFFRKTLLFAVTNGYGLPMRVQQHTKLRPVDTETLHLVRVELVKEETSNGL